jgi:hypothetical protein
MVVRRSGFTEHSCHRTVASCSKKRWTRPSPCYSTHKTLAVRNSNDKDGTSVYYYVLGSVSRLAI